MLAEVTGIRLLMFIRPDDEASQTMVDLIEELADVSMPKFRVEVHHVVSPTPLSILYGIFLFPTLVMLDRFGDDLGVRIVGTPTGYQFGVLIQDLADVASRRLRLLPRSLSFLHNVDQEITLLVAVAPTCPFSPRAARLAHQMAIANPAQIRAYSINATQFPQWVEHYPLQGVPTTWVWIGDQEMEPIEGVISETELIAQIRRLKKDARVERGSFDASPHLS